MGRQPATAALAALAVLATTTLLNAAEADQARQAIEQANAELGAAIAKGDAGRVAQMYTADGQLFPPNSEIVEGQAAIEAFWKGAIDAGIARVELRSIDVESFGDTIVETGKAMVYNKQGALADKGKYVVVWKKVGSQWKLHRDCWNTSQPAASP